MCEVNNTTEIIVDIDLPAKIKVEFSPYKARPIVRLNNIMLNYWLANIMLYDHYLEFDVPTNFFLQYKDRDMQGRIDHVPADEAHGQHYFDRYIGINNLYPELIDEIRKLLIK